MTERWKRERQDDVITWFRRAGLRRWTRVLARVSDKTERRTALSQSSEAGAQTDLARTERGKVHTRGAFTSSPEKKPNNPEQRKRCEAKKAQGRQGLDTRSARQRWETDWAASFPTWCSWFYQWEHGIWRHGTVNKAVMPMSGTMLWKRRSVRPTS